MNIKNTVASLGAALILAGAPALASAATATAVNVPSPIRVDSVQIEQYYGQFDNFFPGLVTVSFTNQTAQPVTNVVFDLKSANGQLLRQYDDAGNYLPGASAKHAFNNTEEGANQTLAVDSVTFADGTTWSNADAFTSRRQAAAVSTASLFPYVELN
jgi:hypothetical protein